MAYSPKEIENIGCGKEPPSEGPEDWLGVDLGIVNIAADSDGETYSGGHLNGLRKRYAKLRARLPDTQAASAMARLLPLRIRRGK